MLKYGDYHKDPYVILDYEEDILRKIYKDLHNDKDINVAAFQTTDMYTRDIELMKYHLKFIIKFYPISVKISTEKILRNEQ